MEPTIDFSANPLVEVEWLAAHLNTPGLRVVDARWRGDGTGRSRYAKGHIPGAVHLDWERDLSAWKGSIQYSLLSPDEFASAVGRCGIGNSTRVLAYADEDYSGAARLWWALRYYGHEQVAVLNGGWDRWVDEGNPIDSGVVEAAPAVFHPKPQPRLLATREEVLQASRNPDGGVKLVDTRPPEQFAGQAVWTPMGSRYLPHGQGWVEIHGRRMRAGHIPGAAHLVSSDNLDPRTWTYLPGDILMKRAENAGLRRDQRVITYCGCGISASLGLLGLHLAGFRDLALYDGSWEEWGTDPESPIEVP